MYVSKNVIVHLENMERVLGWQSTQVFMRTQVNLVYVKHE